MTPPRHATPPALGPIRQVVLQSTGFCNIDCAYCYLPDRRTRTVMPLDTVRATAQALSDSGLLAPELEVRWHAGEPLTVARPFYAQAHALLRRALGDRTRLSFSLQTNGLLLDGGWADFLRREEVRVGVSLDGPAQVHDAYRRTRGGAGTLARALKGTRHLVQAGLPYDVISVITPVTLAHTGAYLDFMAELAPRSLGLNPEETEGGNDSALHRADGFEREYRAFLRRVARWSERTGVEVREFAAMRRHVLHHALPVRNTQNEPLSIVTVGADGRVSSFSPELYGWTSARYGDFTAGRVTDPGFRFDRWPDTFRLLASDIERGRAACERTCAYYAVCGGGAPANKWAERADMAATSTAFCSLGVMAVADVVLDGLELDGLETASR
ncbi:cyclophane-forming radical SAM/SPASM peptide maturase GrrM/OscB [Streptomyces sp. bgisy159]|uniref:cyclophane-forming radical SAM/SPASM peptide maturase GrrM/OscB n=1 Tax=Streptomyces sp. bgisy159 TaxID=3413795 RepID=UPI003F4A1124